MASKKKSTVKKVAKKKSTKDLLEEKKAKLEHELWALSNEDKLQVISRALSVSLDTDNYGQIVIYTDLMYSDESKVVPFEVDCPKDHVEYEEDHECEL